MIAMPMSERALKQEWNKTLIMAQNNVFPAHLIHGMKRQLMTRKEGTTQTQVVQQNIKKVSPSHTTAFQYTRSPAYSKEPT